MLNIDHYDKHKERLTPKNLARHFRNAVAHNHLTILPKEYIGEGIITGVEFLMTILGVRVSY